MHIMAVMQLKEYRYQLVYLQLCLILAIKEVIQLGLVTVLVVVVH